ncbi:TetR family transcriptional regulator [Haematobacter massiliensis]|uniref:TetR family transcriptional regulator n=2 Tax=Haematobacter massiliensis TaxID=195105 RepID=A0A086Y272_9RHOB|nr:TetR family transcriptional regulator [Haematobacter massiliensis]OWJ84688.1 TetR family transcriptional regulator [Haematobacter massiliensis]QBJ26347.1 TetR/AcrR family transcriptional regulator [Haematobacter massiliensis]
MVVQMPNISDRAAQSQKLNPVAQRLLAAATTEFQRYGFSGASISRIIDAAECNVRMIYHYFGNKLGLYRACIEQVYEQLRQAEAEAIFWDLPPEQAIAELTRFTFDYMEAHPEFQGMMRIENMSDGIHVRELTAVNKRAETLFHAIEKVLDRGVAGDVFAHRADPAQLYLSILGLATIHIANRHTMGMVLGLDLSAPDFLVARREEVVRTILASLKSPAV